MGFFRNAAMLAAGSLAFGLVVDGAWAKPKHPPKKKHSASAPRSKSKIPDHTADAQTIREGFEFFSPTGWQHSYDRVLADELQKQGLLDILPDDVMNFCPRYASLPNRDPSRDIEKDSFNGVKNPPSALPAYVPNQRIAGVSLLTKQGSNGSAYPLGTGPSMNNLTSVLAAVDEAKYQSENTGRPDRTSVWLQYFKALSLTESNWSPQKYYDETDHREVDHATNSGHRYSIGLFQLSKTDDCSGSGVKFTSYTDVENTTNNIKCAVAIMKRLLLRNPKLVYPKQSSYWSTSSLEARNRESSTKNFALWKQVIPKFCTKDPQNVSKPTALITPAFGNSGGGGDRKTASGHHKSRRGSSRAD